MARFIKEDDYEVQIRQEIATVMDAQFGRKKLITAENMAIGQIRNHLAGKYDCNAIFAPAESGTDTRDAFIVMIVIDIALYHLWSKEAPGRVPKHREMRYTDALEWLKDVQNGKPADLPLLKDNSGENISDVRLWSTRTLEDNRF